MAADIFPTILKQLIALPDAALPGFGMEVRFMKPFTGMGLTQDSRLMLDGTGGVRVSIPSPSGNGILPGAYAGMTPKSEVMKLLRQLQESGIEKHPMDSGEAEEVLVSLVSATHVFRFAIGYADEALRSILPALESMVAQALKAPEWALSLSARARIQPGKPEADLSLTFVNSGSCGIWIGSPWRSTVPDEAPICEAEVARKPQIAPLPEFDQLKRSHIAIQPVEAGRPLLWLGPRMTIAMRAKAVFPSQEPLQARIKYRSDSGEAEIAGVPRFLGSLVSPVFEPQS